MRALLSRATVVHDTLIKRTDTCTHTQTHTHKCRRSKVTSCICSIRCLVYSGVSVLHPSNNTCLSPPFCCAFSFFFLFSRCRKKKKKNNTSCASRLCLCALCGKKGSTPSSLHSRRRLPSSLLPPVRSVNRVFFASLTVNPHFTPLHSFSI